MKRILAFFALASCAFAGTWIASPGKGSHAAAGGAGPTFVAVKEETWVGSQAVVSMTNTLSVLAGDLIVVGANGTASIGFVRVGAASASTAQTDFTSIREVTAEGYSVAMWYYVVQATDTALVIQIGFNGGNFTGATATQYRGLGIASTLDVSTANVSANNAQSDHATNRTAVNVTTTNANDLLVFFELDWENHTTYTAQSGWTKRTAVGTKNNAIADRYVTSTGSYPNGNVFLVDDSAVDDGYYSIMGAFKVVP